ncbi:histidine phosphatase family protein [Candidatus Gracilibacteria bacterium]|nr:histidine phosphatase family protein [Candidatus Gracilibacteria bacterium]
MTNKNRFRLQNLSPEGPDKYLSFHIPTMRLVPNLPKEGFQSSPNMKLYVGGLQKPLLDILDMEKFQQLPINIINDNIPETRRITFIRHLESKYNEYKELIKSNPDYQEFMTTTDISRKKELAMILLKDFFAEVGIDYETGLSSQGHEDGEVLSKLYAQLIKSNPEIFPDLIYISPYIRTRTTAHYLLKNIEGLDIDFDKMIDENKLEDLIIGSFNGKDIAIKMDERIRERDHGANVAPSFIRDFRDGEKGFHDLLSKLQREKVYYHTAPAGGESQVQTNARAKEFLLRNFEKNKFGNMMVVSHHLTMIGALLSIFGGSFQTFYKLNDLRRPANGSFTMLSQIPKTEVGEENKFRVSAYNLSLQE